ncbi:MAG: MFS transporter [Firmicutes bacterium]|nr:MFS transporter [Bacillota bacterium]
MNKKTIKIFFLLSAVAGMAYFAPLLKFTFYDQMMEALSLDDMQINVLSSIYAFVNIFMYPVSGVLGEMFSARKLIAVTMFGMGLLTIWYAFTTDFHTLIVIHSFYSFFVAGTFWCPFVKAIRSLGDESMQGRLFGMSEALRGLSQAAIGVVALLLVCSAVSVDIGFSNMLLVSAAVYLILGVLVLKLMPEEADKEKIESKSNAGKTNLVSLLKNPGVWIVTIIVMSGLSLWILANTYLTTYSVRVLGISESHASLIGIIRNYVIVFVAGFGGGWLMDRFCLKGKVLSFLFGLSVLSLVVMLKCSALVVFSIALTMIITLFVNVIKSTYFSVLGQAGIPVAVTASATGVISFFAFIPESFIALIGGSWLKAAELTGNVGMAFDKIFLMMIGFSLCGLLGSLFLWIRAKKSLS